MGHSGGTISHQYQAWVKCIVIKSDYWDMLDSAWSLHFLGYYNSLIVLASGRTTSSAAQIFWKCLTNIFVPACKGLLQAKFPLPMHQLSHYLICCACITVEFTLQLVLAIGYAMGVAFDMDSHWLFSHGVCVPLCVCLWVEQLTCVWQAKGCVGLIESPLTKGFPRSVLLVFSATETKHHKHDSDSL